MLMMNYLLNHVHEVFEEYQQLDDYYVDFQHELDDHANEPKKRLLLLINIVDSNNNLPERFELHEFHVQLLF
jgi:hypothetical protein